MIEKLADDLLYGARAISKYTGIPERAVYGYAEKGAIPSFKVGGTLCARKSEIERGLSAGAVATETKERKSVQFFVRAEPSLMERFDHWRGDQSRSEAVRKLIMQTVDKSG